MCTLYPGSLLYILNITLAPERTRDAGTYSIRVSWMQNPQHPIRSWQPYARRLCLSKPNRVLQSNVQLPFEDLLTLILR